MMLAMGGFVFKTAGQLSVCELIKQLLNDDFLLNQADAVV
jgi:hypothetical protein